MMKNFKLVGGIIIFAAIVGVNVWNVRAISQSNGLNVSDIENVADGWEWNGFSDWFTFGFRADEITEKIRCSHEYTYYDSEKGIFCYQVYVHQKVNCYSGGNTNCTPTECPQLGLPK